MSGVLTLSLERWEGPFDEDLRLEAVAGLEAGRVLFLPRLPFILTEAEQRLVAEASTADSEGGAKNVSYEPSSGACKAGPLSEPLAEGLKAPLARFCRQAAALIEGLAPAYAPGLEVGRASFRPVEVEGRSLSWRKDDRRLHVDAFPSRPLRGRRILRVFSNVDPSGGCRRWLLGEPFEDHLGRFRHRLRSPDPVGAWVRQRLGLTHGRQSAYDQLMLGLHDAAKRDSDYQSLSGALTHDFPAGSSWIVYTDQTPHAAIRGRCAFEQTFYVQPEVLLDPQSAPLAVLERQFQRPLV